MNVLVYMFEVHTSHTHESSSSENLHTAAERSIFDQIRVC